jgi:hypothetical protein
MEKSYLLQECGVWITRQRGPAVALAGTVGAQAVLEPTSLPYERPSENCARP